MTAPLDIDYDFTETPSFTRHSSAGQIGRQATEGLPLNRSGGSGNQPRTGRQSRHATPGTTITAP
jgi:hypothetical protein